ncbi:MAG: glycerate kinase [Actinomycetota bacterium]|nr:glycerate kinase [Actinomycetota bacterium]
MRALVSPASLKGVLSAGEAAAALARGLRESGADAEELPIADGGEGTAAILASALGLEACVACHVHDAFGRPRAAPIRYVDGGIAIVEAAEVIPLEAARLDPFTASSAGLGELIAQVEPGRALVICLGGTATMDGGEGLSDVKHKLPGQTTALVDTVVTLRDAVKVFGAQKGARPTDVPALEARLAGRDDLAPHADLPGSGAAGGLGAALAALGATLVPGAPYVLERVRFRDHARNADLVVTGEGVVDATTPAGKAPGEAARVCGELGVRCVVFGGRVEVELEGAELVELSGDATRAREDLVELGRRLAG